MPGSRDLLQRFRPAGTPGAAAAPGVPADRVAEASAELEPVLARLADTQEEVVRIRAEAAREAELRRRETADRVAALVAAARRQAASDRADAALRVSRAAETENAEALDEARRAAATVQVRAAERMPSYVDGLVVAMRSAMRTAGQS